MKHFENETLFEIMQWLEYHLQHIRGGEIIEFVVPNPDLSTLGWRGLGDLALIFYCKMLTPSIFNDAQVVIRFQKLQIHNSFHLYEPENITEKYGITSPFWVLSKAREPAFLHYYQEALKNAKLQTRQKILNLGINNGEEFEIIKNLVPNDIYNQMNLTGVDFSASAIKQARKRLPQSNVSLYCHNINSLDELELGRFDLLISIGTLQSSTLNFKPLFMSLIQNYLYDGGAVILGFPNCRWIDGEMIYGAKAPNYNFSEMSLVIKDIYFCKKYLQQHNYRVTITGKEYLFLTGTKIREK